MNIKKLLSMAAVVALLAACSDYDPGLSDQVSTYTAEQEAVLDQYGENFVTRYGAIDPNHTWGFGSMETRTVEVNRNMWDSAVKDENNQIVDYTTWTNYQGKTMVVPGFPSKVEGDGQYYIEENNAAVAYTKEQLIAKGQDSYLPVGDVTDEEIQYVSEWFRNNPNPRSEVPHFTEFYIMDISQDYDRVEYPNGEAINRNLQVYNNGSIDENGWFEGEDYPDNGTDPITFGMDFFAVQTSNGSWEHENNFNKQKTNPLNGSNPNNSTIFPNRSLKYWYSGHYEWPNGVQTLVSNGYTTNFSYHNSDNNTDYTRFVLVHLSFPGPRTGRHYDGYYLAFDYEYKKLHAAEYDENGNPKDGTIKYSQQKPDGYYSNWIVKLAPADPYWNWEKDEPGEEPEPDPTQPDPDPDPVPVVTWTHRIFCEDLGSTYDFDFNDVVFDAYVKDGNTYVKILASGGTLPIYVGPKSAAECTNEYEAHHILNPNVQLNSKNLYDPILRGTASRIIEVQGVTNIAEVKIYVDGNLLANVNDADNNTIIELPSQVGAYGGSGNLNGQTAGTRGGNPPYKLCVPVGTRWPNEQVQIETVYPYFRYWVQNENSVYNYGGTNDWTKTIGDRNKLVGE